MLRAEYYQIYVKVDPLKDGCNMTDDVSFIEIITCLHQVIQKYPAQSLVRATSVIGFLIESSD